MAFERDHDALRADHARRDQAEHADVRADVPDDVAGTDAAPQRLLDLALVLTGDDAIGLRAPEREAREAQLHPGAAGDLHLAARRAQQATGVPRRQELVVREAHQQHQQAGAQLRCHRGEACQLASAPWMLS
jgi:hypothetical protein